MTNKTLRSRIALLILFIFLSLFVVYLFWSEIQVKNDIIEQQAAKLSEDSSTIVSLQQKLEISELQNQITILKDSVFFLTGVVTHDNEEKVQDSFKILSLSQRLQSALSQVQILVAQNRLLTVNSNMPEVEYCLPKDNPLFRPETDTVSSEINTQVASETEHLYFFFKFSRDISSKDNIVSKLSNSQGMVANVRGRIQEISGRYVIISFDVLKGSLTPDTYSAVLYYAVASSGDLKNIGQSSDVLTLK